MKIKDILKDSLYNFKKHLLSSLMISLLGGIIISAIVLVSSYGYLPIILLVMPFVIVPLFFSMMMVHYELRKDVNPSFSDQARFFTSYFTNKYRGIFKIIFGLLISLLIFLFLSILTSVIAERVCYSIFPNFPSLIKEIVVILDQGSLEELNRLFLDNSNELGTYLLISYMPLFYLIFLVFIYRISIYSIFAYLRRDMLVLSAPYFKYLLRTTKKIYSKDLNKESFALNFPIYILFTLGFVFGTLITWLLSKNLILTLAVSLSAPFLLMTLFLPFYFSNNESIYLAHKLQFFQFEETTRKQLTKTSLNGMVESDKDNIDE